MLPLLGFSRGASYLGYNGSIGVQNLKTCVQYCVMLMQYVVHFSFYLLALSINVSILKRNGLQIILVWHVCVLRPVEFHPKIPSKIHPWEYLTCSTRCVCPAFCRNSCTGVKTPTVACNGLLASAHNFCSAVPLTASNACYKQGNNT